MNRQCGRRPGFCGVIDGLVDRLYQSICDPCCYCNNCGVKCNQVYGNNIGERRRVVPPPPYRRR